MKLYIINAWNKNGGNIGQYHVVASGINKAKAALRASEPSVDRVEMVSERSVIIAPEPAESTGAGFQNSGEWETDGLSGFRG